MTFAWTDENVAIAKRLYVDEGRSAAQAVKAMGNACSRNALVGKAHRLGWTKLRGEGTGTLNNRRSKRKVGLARAVVSAPVFLPALFLVEGSEPKPWLDREKGMCAFPVEGDGWNVRSCCEPVSKGAYCAEHYAVIYKPTKQPREAA